MFDEPRRLAICNEAEGCNGMDADDSEEWQDVDVSEEWGPITPSMATATSRDIIEPQQDLVNIVHKHHHVAGVVITTLNILHIIYILLKMIINVYLKILTLFNVIYSKSLQPTYTTTITCILIKFNDNNLRYN